MPARESFEPVYNAEFRTVWRFLYRLGARGAQLEDLTHDVFLTAFRRFDTYDRSRPVGPWLCGIAFRVFADFNQLAYRKREVGEDHPSVAEPQLDGQDAAEAYDRRRLLDRVLSRIDVDRRALFVMHEVEGYSIPEVAASLGIPVPTAYTRLRTARLELAKHVEALRGGEP